MILKDKVCFITGSTRGIGWAVAREFARNGAIVLLNSRTDGGLLDERRQQLSAEFGVEALGLAADATNWAAVKSCYQEIFRRFKRLDVLVNNAGILEDGSIGMMSEAMIRRVVDTNVVGPMIHLQEAARLMTRNRAGSIINLSSIMGRFGNAGVSIYAASKAGIIGMTLAAAKELAPKNVRVNAIAPGFIDTDMTSSLTEQVRQEKLTSIKMGRVGRTEEVASAVLFLASEMASYVTGQVLGVDGGMIV